MKTEIKSKTVLKTDSTELLHKRKSKKTKIKSFNNRMTPILSFKELKAVTCQYGNIKKKEKKTDILLMTYITT